KARDEGNKRAALALAMFTYRIKKYIASYAAAMGGVDVVIFTGGIGENVGEIRERSVEGLEFMGIKMNKELNNTICGSEAIVSTDDSKVKVMVIPTNEELVLARDSKKLYEEKFGKK
ncbi:acetate kinase, partial [bacterium]|nr:acetate kinase [bacterium]